MASPKTCDAIFMAMLSVHTPSHPIEGTGTLGPENGGKWAAALQSDNLPAWLACAEQVDPPVRATEALG